MRRSRFGWERTVDGEQSGFTESSTGDVLSTASVVGRVAESRLTDDQIAFVRDDEVDIAARVDQLAVFQPKHLQRIHNKSSQLLEHVCSIAPIFHSQKPCTHFVFYYKLNALIAIIW